MSTEFKNDEEFQKSMDQLIDEVFMDETPETSEEETVEKSDETPVEEAQAEEETVEKGKDAIHEIIGDTPQAAKSDDPNTKSETRADADLDSGEKSEEDDEKGKKRGRSKDISSWEDRGKDGDTSSRQYDRDITAPAQDPSKPEDSQVKAPEHVAKSEKETVEVSKEEFEAFKKSQEEKAAAEKEEALQKAKAEQTDLIKSAVTEATSELRDELKKANETIEKLASKPKQRRSIDSVVALEKGGYAPNSETGKPETFSKSEILDAAEDLFEKGKVTADDVIEIEMTGTVNNPNSKRLITNHLKGK